MLKSNFKDSLVTNNWFTSGSWAPIILNRRQFIDYYWTPLNLVLKITKNSSRMSSSIWGYCSGS